MPAARRSPFVPLSFGAACGLLLGTGLVFAHNARGHLHEDDSHEGRSSWFRRRSHHRAPPPPSKQELYGTIPLYDNPGVERLIFEHISEEYNDLGQIERGEVEVTVRENVFSQIGVVDTKGTRDMYFAWLDAAREQVLRRRVQHIKKLNKMSIRSVPKEEEEEVGFTRGGEGNNPVVVKEINPWDLVSQEKELSIAIDRRPTAATETTSEPHTQAISDVPPAETVRPSAKHRADKFLLMTGLQSPSLVFCDIGSGVGNVCLQVLGEVPSCPKVVGIEIIPSRHKNAVIAFENAQRYFPTFFGSPPSSSRPLSIRRKGPLPTSQRKASFYEVDLVNCGKTLRDEQVGVIFSHSWMFDDSLMKKFADVVNATSKPEVAANEALGRPSSLWCVITSRPFLDNETGKPLLDPNVWELHSERQFSADWNPHSHFFMYTKKV